jgi:hypothetical protein
MFRCLKGPLGPRRHLSGIKYSKKTIAVEFFLARPPDEKSLSESESTSAALRAAPPVCPPAEKQKRPGRNLRPNLFQSVCIGENGSVVKFVPKIEVSFPNIAHSYWENFRLTGEFHVRQAKAPKF